MWIFKTLLITALLASTGGRYHYQRPRRMHNFDLAIAGDDGEAANEGGFGVGNGNGNRNVEELNNGCKNNANRNGGCGRHMGERGGMGGRGMGGRNKGESAKQRSSGIALLAAKEAKKANDEMAPAVKAASDKIKTEYADKATAAANAADAVLFGKAQLLEQLEAEVCNARDMLEPEVQKLATFEANDVLAGRALTQSRRQLKNIVAAIKGAKEKQCSADHLLAVWETSVADGSTIMDAAQKRVNMLMPILTEVIQDREKTKKAAESAARAAEEARNRIASMDKPDRMEKTEGSCNDNQDRDRDRERQRRAWPWPFNT